VLAGPGGREPAALGGDRDRVDHLAARAVPDARRMQADLPGRESWADRRTPAFDWLG
jgi:hypothetical protein